MKKNKYVLDRFFSCVNIIGGNANINIYRDKDVSSAVIVYNVDLDIVNKGGKVVITQKEEVLKGKSIFGKLFNINANINVSSGSIVIINGKVIKEDYSDCNGANVIDLIIPERIDTSDFEFKVDGNLGDVKFNNIDFNNALVKTGKGKVSISDATVGKVDIETGIGDVKFSNIEFNNAVVETGNGNVFINDATVDKVDIETGIGDVELINSDFEDIKVKTGGGKVSISDATVGKVDIETNLGNIDLCIIGSKDNYYTNFKTNLGKVECYSDGEYSSSDEKHLFKVKSNLGDIKVKFRAKRKNRG